MTDQMTPPPPLHGVAGSQVVLFGQRCANCGRVDFPRQGFGCEACGAYGNLLEPIEIPAQGILLSFAQVHRHHGRDIAAPFVIGKIALDAGPAVRCTLAARDAGTLRRGIRVTGILAPPDDPAQERELRFAAAGDSQ